MSLDTKLPKRFTNQPEKENIEYFEITIPQLKRNPIFIYTRTSTQCVCRVEVVYVTAGDIFFLYLIMKNRAVISFEDAMTVDDVRYATFQQSAVASGYVKDRKEALECYRNVAENTLTPQGDIHLTPANLRGLFCHLTLEGYPTREIYDTPELLEYMLTDFKDKGMSTSQVRTSFCTRNILYTHHYNYYTHTMVHTHHILGHECMAF
jgi:hypothetical protein